VETLNVLCALGLAGCPAYEGPIDVVLVGVDEGAVIEWAAAGSDRFEACANATTDPAAVVGCGPDGVGEPGDYVVRVTWAGATAEKAVTLVKDNDYQANVVVTFDAAALGQ